MDALREPELRQFAPKIKPAYLNALIDGWPELTRAGINTPLRVCHFLAQTAHETGGFTIIREATNWTPEQMCQLWPGRFKSRLDPKVLKCRGDEVALANLAYSARQDIGNEGGDDGWHYRGGGFLQTTGRANFRAAGAAIGIDLESNPEQIEDGHISLKAAIWEWTKLDLNQFADHNYVRAIGNAINRGNPYATSEPIGAASREQWLIRAWALFGEGELPNPQELALGAYGPAVHRLQSRLRELGYGVGAQDHVFGPTLARAVVAFKHDYQRKNYVSLEPMEVVGADTWAALDKAEPIKLSPERVNATPKQLAKMGSTEVKAGLKQQAAAKLALAGGMVEGSRQLGLLDSAAEYAGKVSALKASIVPAIEAVSWGLKHAFWVAAILLAVWVWHQGRAGILARLEAHIKGMNLWR